MANYYVTKNKNGTWNAKKENADRASAIVDTQKLAEKIAKTFSANSGGGEVRIQGEDYRFRDSDTVPPGHESKYKDKKH